ncbi:hypothetical protein [Limosilactobacillus caccae]|uniref:hypothetical protein n=1 Tax=Limosilactobacillus caccae TaxID=1926284 RepID=UPI0009710F84|nr:hypothetical protein [Limosilactobacillus caccae]
MKKHAKLGIQVLLFLGILLFLTRFAPLLPFDGDDWRYIGGFRQPIPLWGAWNPTRILPEVLMPLGGSIAAFIVYPISKDYVGSLAFTESLIEAIFIFAMLYYFYKVLIKRFLLSEKLAVACEIICFLSFFLLFKKFNQSSYTGFWAADLACVFYYIVPGLLNILIVLYMLQFKFFNTDFNRFNNLRKGIFIFLLYFAIFSNTQLNIIIATFSFAKLVQIIYRKVKGYEGNLLKDSWLYLLILIFWILTVIFDLNGQRAQDVSSSNKGTFLHNLGMTVKQFIYFIKQQNTFILILSLLIIMVTLIMIAVVNNNLKLSRDFLKVISCMIFCSLTSLMYLLLAYTKAGSSYAGRPDSMWAVTTFFILALNFSIAYCVMTIKWIKPFLPLGIIIGAVFSFNTNERPIYAANTMHDPVTIKRIDNYIINQIVAADSQGKARVIVKVPLEDKNASSKVTTSNWPHPYNMAVWMQNTLYSHRIIRTRIHVIFKPDSKVNEEFYENASEQQAFFPPE